MPLGILNNIPSLAAENQLTMTSSALSNTLQQLSSGSRINSGADDPAGLSIANGLQANISALTQSVSNANNGVGQLQLADGALAQVTNLLNTAVTLATESATGTVSDGQRTSIQAQYASILAEINRIGQATTYNGQAVFQSGTSTNVNAVTSGNNGTTAPLTSFSPLTAGDATTVTAGGQSFTYTATAAGAANPNTITGSYTGLTNGTALNNGAVLTLTRGSTGLTTTYTVGAGGSTMGQLLAAINTGTVASGVNLTIAGTDTSHVGYTASINPAGSLQITDLNKNNNLAATMTGGTASTTQFSTAGQNFSTTTALAANEVVTIARTGQTATYTVGASGSTMGQLITAINTGQTQTNGAGQSISVAATVGSLAVAAANLSATLSNGNLVVTDSSALGSLAVSESTGAAVNTSVQGGTALGAGAATVLNAGYTMTLTRGGKNTTYTVNAGGTATAQALLQAINSGISTTGVGGITIGGAGSAAGFSASIDAGNLLNVTDTTYSGALTGFQSGIYAANEAATTSTSALVGGTLLANSESITLTRANGSTVTYTSLNQAGSSITNLLAVIGTGTTTANFSVTNSGTAGNLGLSAAIASVNGVNQIVITDAGGGALTATTSSTGANVMANGATTTQTLGPAYTAMAGNGPGVFTNASKQFAFAANGITVGGTFTANTTTPSTVQDLLNAINNDTTVGAKGSILNGQLVISDPLNRGNLSVTTNDSVLGASVSGAPTKLANATTTAAATVNHNQLQSNAGTTIAPITAQTSLTGVTQFVASGRTFTFTANSTNGTHVGDLIAAINNPSDPAGLKAYLQNNQLVVVDPNNGGDVAVGAGNTEGALGTFTNSSTTGSTSTNIYLSDSTAIGSSQIAVSIGGLATSSLADGTGAQAVNLATTDLSTATDAQTALTQINKAISNIASVRGTLGASVNRLTAASNVINSQVQNLTSAENTLTAADIPAVVANMTKYSILEQTGISALAQANQQQQLVLKLLQ
jgi:flagellin